MTPKKPSNKSTKPSTKQKKSNIARNTLLVVVVTVICAVGAYLIYDQISQRLDESRFSQANTEKQAIANEIINKLGKPLETEEKNVCYNTEQGPYDNGNLWCRTSAAIYFPKASDVNFDSLQNVIKDAKLFSIDLNEALVELNNGIKCSLENKTGVVATNPSRRFSTNNESKQTILIICADRAKAKHYPFVQ
jgi:hypothetical protein